MTAATYGDGVELADNYFPLQKALKLVGIGKKGSRPIPADLIESVADDIKQAQSPAIARGAFFAALLYRARFSLLGPEEQGLFRLIDETSDVAEILASRDSASLFLRKIFSSKLPETWQDMALDLLEGKKMSLEEAEKMADFLLKEARPANKQSGREAFCGFVISYLRLRYESFDEWCGFYNSLKSRLLPLENHHRELIIFSEPMNGFKQSMFLSPLIAAALRREYPVEVAHLSGRNPGPKFYGNLRDLEQGLSFELCTGLGSYSPDHAKSFSISPERCACPFGKVFHVETMCPDLDSWVERRWDIVKRPCWASLEKFLNPFQPIKAKYLISSAFHPSYVPKMLALAQYADYEGILIASLGAEGGLGASARGLILTASKKRKAYSAKSLHQAAGVSSSGMPEESDAKTRDFQLDFEEDNERLAVLSSGYQSRQFRFLESYSHVKKSNTLVSAEQNLDFNLDFIRQFSFWGTGQEPSQEGGIESQLFQTHLKALEVSIPAYMKAFRWLLD